MGRARRVAAVTLVAVLVAAALVAVLPASLLAVRVGGIPLAWWSWALAGAAVAIAGTVTLLVQDAGHAVGSGDLLRWASPALLVSISALVFAGAPGAALVATAALAAPLLGSLLSGTTGRAPGLVERLAVPVAVALVLAAQLLVAGDVAIALGLPRGVGIAPALALLAICPESGRPHLRHAPAAAGALAVALGVGLVWAQSATTPWTAWSLVASRPLLAFSDQAPAVASGIEVRAPSSLVFTDAQQVTVLTGGVYRVVERDGLRPMMREWRLAAGESLAVRTGDELMLAAGARVRFERGKRVPGAPTSGVTWGQSRPPAPLAALGTFVGAALTLVGLGARTTTGTARDRTAGIVALGGGLVLVAGAAAWGVYAALAGPEVGLGMPAAGALIGAARRLAPASGYLSVVWLPIACAGLLAGLSPVLRTEVARAVAASDGAPARGWAAWIAALAAAATVAILEPVGAWRALGLGAGLMAAVFVAPRLVAAPRARALAQAVGGVVFAATTVAGALGRPDSVVAEYPALVAVPLAWAAGWLLDRPDA
jgi:hypothetical protein